MEVIELVTLPPKKLSLLAATLEEVRAIMCVFLCKCCIMTTLIPTGTFVLYQQIPVLTKKGPTQYVHFLA
jgi:hypothetical protein